VGTARALTEIIVGAAVLGIVAGTLWMPARVDVRILGNTLVVRPRGLDVLLTLRRQVEIPLSQVAMIRAVSRGQAPRVRIPRPRRHFPGGITAGSFGTGADRTFWDIRRADRVLLVSCRLDAEYKLLVLEVPDPEATAASLNAVLAGR